MYQTDKEIIAIVKEIWRKKYKDEILDPDDLLQQWIIKSFGWVSLLIIVLSLFGKLFSPNMANSIESLGALGSSVTTFFFMTLFLYLNKKSEHPSIILYGLTGMSSMIAIWFT